MRKKNRVTLRRQSLCRMFFIKPAAKANADEVAERLLSIESTREVFISEGDYGFVVRSDHSEADDLLHDYISRTFKGNYGKAVCHYRYSR